jgi:hypothetical protein
MKKLTILAALLFTQSLVYAGIIARTNYTDGQTITAALQNTNENTIVTEINGNIESANILNGTIVGADLADSIITSAKILNNTIASVDLSSPIINGSTANSGGEYGHITQGSISTPDFRANAVSLIASSFTATGGGAGGALFKSSATITTIGKPVIIFATCDVVITVDVNKNAGFTGRILRDGGAITSGGFARTTDYGNATSVTGDFALSMLGYDTPSAGAHTYAINYTFSAGTLSAGPNCNVIALELRT